MSMTMSMSILLLFLLHTATASTTGNYVAMPDGFSYHASCVHQHNTYFALERLPGGRTRVRVEGREDGQGVGEHPEDSHYNQGFPPEIKHYDFGACPFDRVPTTPASSPSVASPDYYSDWSVYVQSAGPSYNYMTSTWQVPPAPKSRGPLGLSSVYLFNGLEDGSGHHGNSSLILQPVLLFGKSGCLVNPASWGEWHVGSYLVDGNGRAHCGKHFQVKPKQTVVGTMAKAPGSNTWTVSATAVGAGGQGNQTSTYTSSLGDKQIDAAYLTLEGMVIYNCATYPPSNGVTFKDVQLGTASGGVAQKIMWKSMVRHNECGQHTKVESDEGKAVSLLWNADA